MTDTISKAAKDRASALIHESVYETQLKYNAPACMLTERNGAVEALARVLQEHSDKAKLGLEHITQRGPDRISEVLPALQSMILPDDEPDPLGDAWKARWPSSTENLELLRADLDAAGYEIRRKDG